MIKATDTGVTKIIPKLVSLPINKYSGRTTDILSARRYIYFATEDHSPYNATSSDVIMFDLIGDEYNKASANRGQRKVEDLVALQKSNV